MLKKIITLNSVSLIVAECVTFGTNQLAQLNHNLDATERIQDRYASNVVDGDAGSTALGLTPCKFTSVILQPSAICWILCSLATPPTGTIST